MDVNKVSSGAHCPWGTTLVPFHTVLEAVRVRQNPDLPSLAFPRQEICAL
jgi:hypothetical protein